MGNVADAALHVGARLRPGPRPLNPLAAEVRRDGRAVKLAVASVLYRQLGAWQGEARIKEGKPLPVVCPPLAALEAGGHHFTHIAVQRTQRRQGPQNRWRINVG